MVPFVTKRPALKLPKPAVDLVKRIARIIGTMPQFSPDEVAELSDQSESRVQLPVTAPQQAEVLAETGLDRIAPNRQAPLTLLQKRGLMRLAFEEGIKQDNIETIIARAVPHLRTNARPESIAMDWLTQFFHRARLISDPESQEVWGRVLALQANRPGSMNRRSLSLLSNMEPSDMLAFQKLCGFSWVLGYPTLMVYGLDKAFLQRADLDSAAITEMVSLDLITLETEREYYRNNLPDSILIYYGTEKYKLILPPEADHSMALGRLSLTRSGTQLAALMGGIGSDERRDFVIKRWHRLGYRLIPLKVGGTMGSDR
ncbi:MAG: DUF2806 domain-containing protein [Alphaproteobacteria bacterium]|nr:DUF2806 domain-containing protein [Alphaproteobacteria bacterium]